MVDPLTVGGLVASALAIAGEAVLKGGVGEGVKDAYQALKGKVAGWGKGAVASLERTPRSAELQTRIAEIVDSQPQEEKSSARDVARCLIVELKQDTNIGVDIGQLESLDVQLGSIEVTEGVGIRIGAARVAGSFSAKKIVVGPKTGKR
jgi:hypothetical protein